MNSYIIKTFKLAGGKCPFLEWFYMLDKTDKKRVEARLIRIQSGNFGDYKNIDNELNELRLKFGSGYRIYYTIHKNEIIILLTGGNKSTQQKDISKAGEYIKILKGKDNE